jgi:hypothetical protein
MALSGIRTWCDFVVVTEATKDISIQRVYFCEVYWLALAAYLDKFIRCFEKGIDPKYLKRIQTARLPEDKVRVESRCVFFIFCSSRMTRSEYLRALLYVAFWYSSSDSLDDGSYVLLLTSTSHGTHACVIRLPPKDLFVIHNTVFLEIAALNSHGHFC